MMHERDALIPLPRQRFEIYVVKTATVPYNYHISVDSIFYSVPFTYAKREVELRISKSAVSVYDGSERIAMHKRTYAHKGSYVTNPDHMPDTHKDFTEWNAARFRRWAKEIGGGVADVIDAILASKPIEQQAYRSCRAIIALADRYGAATLDEACTRALSISRVPTYKAVKAIIDRMTDTTENRDANESHAYLRGASYFTNELFGGEV